MARDKKTAAASSELPPLSVQEEKLIEALAIGSDNTEAYRIAYGAGGYSANSLKVRACRKVAEPHIQAHLRAIRSVSDANPKLTLEACIARELAFAQRAEAAGNYGAAGQAHDRIHKLLGLYVEKIADVTDQHDPVETLRQIAKESPSVAAALAADKGFHLDLDEAGTRH